MTSSELVETATLEWMRDRIASLEKILTMKNAAIEVLNNTVKMKDEKLEIAKAAIERRMKSDDACGRHFDEDLGDVLKEIWGDSKVD